MSSPLSVIALLGYLTGIVLAIVAMLPRLSPQTLGLIPMAIVFNIALGQLVGTGIIPVPLYIDAAGTILVGVLAGPGAGMITGALTGVTWGLINPTVVPFSAAYTMTGLLSGLLAKSIKKSPWSAGISGLIMGTVSAFICAPVASLIFGGTAGAGTGLLVSVFKALGFNTDIAVLLQSLVSDPLDKIILCIVVFIIVRALPHRTVQNFQERPMSSKDTDTSKDVHTYTVTEVPAASETPAPPEAPRLTIQTFNDDGEIMGETEI